MAKYQFYHTSHSPVTEMSRPQNYSVNPTWKSLSLKSGQDLKMSLSDVNKCIEVIKSAIKLKAKQKEYHIEYIIFYSAN